jgi:hypothetical protein
MGDATTDPDLVLQQLTKLSGVKDYVVLNRIGRPHNCLLRTLPDLISLWRCNDECTIPCTGIPIKYNVDMTEARAIKISGLVSELVKASREFLTKRYAHGRGDEPDVCRYR